MDFVVSSAFSITPTGAAAMPETPSSNSLRSTGSPPGATTVTFDLFQVSLAVALVLLGVVGVAGKPLIAAIILVSSLRYALNGLYELTTPSLWRTRPVLPFGRRGEALEAVQGNLEDQIGPIEREAGVLKQL